MARDHREELRRIMTSLGDLRVEAMSVAAVDNLLEAKHAKADALLESLEKVKAKVSEARNAEQGDLLLELKAEAKKKALQLGRICDEIREVEQARQSCVLNARLEDSLGSQRRVRIKTWVVLFLIIFVLGLLLYQESYALAASTIRLLFWIDTACCAVFLANFFYELRLSDSRLWYLKNHWVDLVTSIPIPPALEGMEILRGGRGLRLLRLVRVLRVARFLRVFRILLLFWRGMDNLKDVLDVRLMKKSLTLSLAFILLGGLAMQWAEGQHPAVGSAGESLWWSFTTLVTGGFGDLHNPTTTTGRVLTVALVLGGMVLVGVFTATLTTILVRDGQGNSD